MKYARDIMTEDVISVHPTSPLREAAELLLHNKVSGLPVIDDEGRVVGIISEFALLALMYNPAAANDLVNQHMTCPVLTVEMNTTLREVADMMILNRFRRVPVTCNGRLTGIISRRDLIHAARARVNGGVLTSLPTV